MWTLSAINLSIISYLTTYILVRVIHLFHCIHVSQHCSSALSWQYAISPHRQELKSRGNLTGTKTTKELAQDVQNEVEQDFTHHYRVTDTGDFLNRLHPVERTTLNRILQYTENENLVDSQTQRWTGFPDSASNREEEEEEI